MKEWIDIIRLITDVMLLAAIGIAATLTIVEFLNMWRIL